MAKRVQISGLSAIQAKAQAFSSNKLTTAPYAPGTLNPGATGYNSDQTATMARWQAQRAKDAVEPTTPMGSGVKGQS